MTYVGPRIISKSVGKSYEIELDREEFKVFIIRRKKRICFTFDKFYKSVDFYASLKTVKMVKEVVAIANQKYGVDFE